MNEQRENISRVSEAIAQHVSVFINDHIYQEFRIEALRQYVFANVDGYVAPASPDRILRDLRQKGKLNYQVVSRSRSLYQGLPVTPQGQLFK